MKIVIQNVHIEDTKPGPKGYRTAKVAYSYNGEPRSQNIVSFANPAVFKQVSDWANTGFTGEVDVTLTKNAKGYTEWSAIGGSGASAQQGPSQAPGTAPRAGGFPTPDERAATQVYIVKQSSIANAINILKTADSNPSVDDVIETAQKLVDYVMETPSGS